MAKTRFVNTKFWDDPYIMKLPPYEKLLFLYLLTCPLTNIAGIYEIDVSRIVFDTGIEAQLIVSILKNFEVNKKIYYRSGWIVIVNFIKNQSESPKVKTGIQMALKTVPPGIKRLACIPKQTVPIPLDTISHSNLDSDSDPNLKIKGGGGSKRTFKPREQKTYDKAPEYKDYTGLGRKAS